MDDINRSIIQNIKDGQYYLEARKWYVNKFIYVVSERSYVAILLICYVICLSALGVFYSRVNPMAGEEAYLIPVPDVTTQYATIKHLGNAEQAPQLSVTKHMLEIYVTQRESYNFKQITEQLAGDLDFIQQTTVASEYLKYKNYISINNPFSPVMLYQDSNRIDIKITKINILKSDEKYSQAVVYYNSILHNFVTNMKVVTPMVANINFQIDEIKNVTNNNKLNFSVLSYTVNKIKQN